MSYRNGRRKFDLFGWSLGWFEWLIILAALVYGVYCHFEAKEEMAAMPTEVSVADVASVFGVRDDGQDKSVDIWTTKFKLEFDATDERYRAERELRFFEQTLLQRCLLKTASTNDGHLSDKQVANCQTSSIKEATEAQAYWNKK